MWTPLKDYFHEQGINCIDGIGGLNIGYGAPELVTGGRNGVVKVWDQRVVKAVVTLEPEDVCYEGKNKVFTNVVGNPQDDAVKSLLPNRDCWTVSFGGSYNDHERLISAGYDNGDVKVFDLRTNKMLWEINQKNGICGLEFDRKDIKPNKLVCTTLESSITVFDMKVKQTINKQNKQRYASLTKKGHGSTVWGCRHLPQNRDIFATYGGNGGLNIYKYHYPSKRKETTLDGNIKGNVGSLELLNTRIFSTQPIISLDWNKDKEGLCCFTAMDQSLRVILVTNLDKY